MSKSRPFFQAPANNGSIKMLFFLPEFFFVPMKKVVVESDPVADRTYFLVKDKIVAVGEFGGGRTS